VCVCVCARASVSVVRSSRIEIIIKAVYGFIVARVCRPAEAADSDLMFDLGQVRKGDAATEDDDDPSTVSLARCGPPDVTSFLSGAHAR
jgi:hypothetical protein